MKLYINKHLFILLSAIFICGSCNILDENPKSFIDPEAFYKTASDAQAGVNSIYNILNRIGPQNRNIVILADITSDDLFPLPINNDRVTLDQYTHTSTNGIVVETWRFMYLGISRANTAISRIPGVDMDQTLKDQLIGEAKFLRALYYFYLVRFWGDVPLILEETKSLEDVGKPSRTPANEVYLQIEKDLEEAAASLPEADVLKGGHATKGAAQALLARVYLNNKEWQKCADLCKAIIDSKVYDLWSSYAQVFDIKNENGKESIFEIQFLSGGLGQGSAFPTYFARENSPIMGRGFGSFQPTNDVINTFKEDSAQDARFDVNLKLDPVDKKYYVNKYVDADAIAYPEADNNYIILRYADVLLMYAEALNEISAGNPEAYNAINQIRKRARRNPEDPTHLPDLQNLSQDEFRQAVYKERRAELAFEGHRWFDLKRTGQLLPIMKAQGISNIQEYHLVMPIPLDEISLNKNLIQNDGY